MFSEVLYEDEAFKQRQLSALLASKVCESIPMFMQAANFLLRHHLGRTKQNFGEASPKNGFKLYIRLNRGHFMLM